MKKMNSILCPQNYLTTEDYNYILDHYKSGKSDYVSYKLGRQYKIMLDATDKKKQNIKTMKFLYREISLYQIFLRGRVVEKEEIRIKQRYKIEKFWGREDLE